MNETLAYALYALIAGSLAATAVLGLIYLMMSLRFGSAIDHAESHQTMPEIGVSYYLGRLSIIGRNGYYAMACLAAMAADGICAPAVFREIFAASCGIGSVLFLVRAVRGLVREADDYHRMTRYTVREASDEVLGTIRMLEVRK